MTDEWRKRCHAQRHKTTEQRFWEKVDKSGECWMWTGCTDKNGYGFFRHKGKNLKAHRFVLELMAAPAKPNELVCHHCDNPSCVNPQHLFIGDNSANQQDAAKKGRCRGQILIPEDVLRIRDMLRSGGKIKDIAHVFGVSQKQISSIKNGTKWAHVHY